MLEDEYGSAEEVPAKYKHLYKEADGKWVLISAGEMKTVDDVARVQEGLRKEREDHKETKKKLSQFNNLDPDEVHEKLDRFEELEAAAEGKMDEEKIEQIVQSRIKSKTAPLERELEKVKTENEGLQGEVQGYKEKDRTRKVCDEIRKAAVEAKLRDTAVEDALIVGERLFEIDEAGKIVSKDNVGVTPGVEPSVWLTEVKNSRPHWWPESEGVGAKGGSGGSGGGNNPFTAEHWNMTEQGQIVTADRSRAEQLAKAAGTTIGGPKPAPKK
jgi:hypothetical protein